MKSHILRVFLALFFAVMVFTGVVGCSHGEHPSSADHPAKADHPEKTDEPAKTDHPTKKDHPK